MKTKTKNFIYFAIYVILNAIFIFQLVNLQPLPNEYNVVIISSLLFIMLVIFYSQFKKKETFLNKAGKSLLIILSLLLLFLNVYTYKTGSFIDNISGGISKEDTVSLVVRKNSEYTNISDVKKLTFGKEDAKEEIVSEAIVDFEKQLDQTILTSYYEDYPTLAKALLDKNVEVIIVNEAFRNIISDEIEDFSEKTKIIYEFNKKTMFEKPDVKVTTESFTVMISGIDIYGSINSNSRSDVNILATVNPISKEVLLISIPRDYYLPLGCQNNALDKLTHSGIYGVDCTMNTVGNAFGIDIDYYARVNFNSLINVVDAVGGVNVNVDAPFSTGTYNFPAGENHLDGHKALAFVRDRYHQEGGDRGRGRNQMKIVTALINKMTSPGIIKNYSSVLNSLEGSFQTNMASNDITSLLKMQLKNMSGWDIIEMQVDGTGGTDYAHALGGNAYVMYPDQESVEAAKSKINRLMQ